MVVLMIVVHVLVCVSLIGIVLLQQGKGAEMGAAFGGSSQTLFGSTGATTFLGKLTAGAATVFMLTSMGLTYWGGQRYKTTIISDRPAPAAPAPAPSAPPAPAAAPSASDTAPALPAEPGAGGTETAK
jgi:preprotein translocase subunit SecG